MIVKCPKCAEKFEGEKEWIGQQAECPSCASTITIQSDKQLENLKVKFKSFPKWKRIIIVVGAVIALLVLVFGYPTVRIYNNHLKELHPYSGGVLCLGAAFVRAITFDLIGEGVSDGAFAVSHSAGKNILTMRNAARQAEEQFYGKSDKKQ